jgi:DNA excision repair protein ERCC-2
VFFPYEYIYPEQYNYMCELYRAIKAKGHAALEMPCGTGKTVSLLSLITSYQYANPGKSNKLVYCTRTVPEMEKVLEELKNLIRFREQMISKEQQQQQQSMDLSADDQESTTKNSNGSHLVAIGLSARKNLCIHPRVSIEYDGSKVDAMCRSMTASWVREAAASQFEEQDDSVELCDYFEEFEKSGIQSILPDGVYTLRDLKVFGKKYGWCPYFLSRRAIEYANIIVYSYAYMLDPKIAALVSRSLSKDCIVVFDEAHNIDNVCIEALSVNINKQILHHSMQNINTLEEHIVTAKRQNANRLTEEYQRLVTGLASRGVGRSDELMSNPVLPQDILNEAVPGNIRKGEHFIRFLRRFVEYVRTRLDVKTVVTETPETFLNALEQKILIEPRMLRFVSERLNSLLNTLEIKDTYEFRGVKVLADFATLVGTYQDGFIIIIEPHDDRTPQIYDPVLQFSCMDASIAISKPVFGRFDTVIITSGTLSPLNIYPKLLQFTPSVSKSLPMTLTRNCVCPLVLTRGSDQVSVSTSYKIRNDPAVVRNYGSLLVELSKFIPDGVICFFTSYQYMEDVVSMWHEMGLLNQITKNKLIFIETPNVAETALALNNYRKACDSGRGAIFMSIARGKVAEGIDFDGHYGRAVVMFGIPYVNTESRILKARLEYIKRKFKINENDFLSFDALRHAAQCIGRVIRNKADYGVMILADKRYNQPEKRKKLPLWIQQQLTNEHLNLSTETLMSVSRKFLKQMAQPYSNLGQLMKEDDIDKLRLQKQQQQQQQQQIVTSEQQQKKPSEEDFYNEETDDAMDQDVVDEVLAGL